MGETGVARSNGPLRGFHGFGREKRIRAGKEDSGEKKAGKKAVWTWRTRSGNARRRLAARASPATRGGETASCSQPQRGASQPARFPAPAASRRPPTTSGSTVAVLRVRASTSHAAPRLQQDQLRRRPPRRRVRDVRPGHRRRRAEAAVPDQILVFIIFPFASYTINIAFTTLQYHDLQRDLPTILKIPPRMPKRTGLASIFHKWFLITSFHRLQNE